VCVQCKELLQVCVQGSVVCVPGVCSLLVNPGGVHRHERVTYAGGGMSTGDSERVSMRQEGAVVLPMPVLYL